MIPSISNLAIYQIKKKLLGAVWSILMDLKEYIGFSETHLE
jgi:hypothetical protein